MPKPAAHESPRANVTVCSRCRKPIFFARTQGGKATPLSVRTHEQRIVAFERDGVMQARYLSTYLSHFADCEYADDFRTKED